MPKHEFFDRSKIYPELLGATGNLRVPKQYAMPPGRLSFINQQPVFIRQTEKQILNRKKIVISDFMLKEVFADDWNISLNFQELLAQLLNDKFEIYIYTAGRAIPITFDNLYDIDIFYNEMQPSDPKQVNSAMAQLGIPQDMLFNLDLPLITQLIMNTEVRCITYRTYEILKNKYLKLPELLKCTHVLNTSPEEAPGFIPLLSPELYSLDDQRLLDLLIKDYDETSKSIPQGTHEAWSNKINELIANGQMISFQFKRLLLNLYYDTKSFKIDLNAIISGVGIKYASFKLGDNPYTNQDDVIAFINKCPDLEVLLLEDLNNERYNKINWQNLKNLKELQLDHAKLTLSQIYNILAHCPDLKKLTLLGCILTDDGAALDTATNLSSLRIAFIFDDVENENELLWNKLAQKSSLVIQQLSVAGSAKKISSAKIPSSEEYFKHELIDYQNNIRINIRPNDNEHKNLQMSVNSEEQLSLAEIKLAKSKDVTSLSLIQHNDISITRFLESTLTYNQDIRNNLLVLDASYVKLSDADLGIILKAFPNLSVLLAEISLPISEDIQQEIKTRNIKAYLKVKKQKNKDAYLASTEGTSDSKSNDVSEGITDGNKDQSFNIKQIFFARHKDYDPAVNNYRNSVLSSAINLDAKIDDVKSAFNLKAIEVKTLLDIKQPKACKIILGPKFREQLASNQLFCSKQIILSNEWQPLPSATSNETITQLSVFDKNGEISSIPVEVKYSPDTNLYYIRSKNVYIDQKPVRVDMVLDVHPQEKFELKGEMLEIAKQCASLMQKPLDLDLTKKYTVRDLLKLSETQKCGVCVEMHILFATKLIQQKIISDPDDIRFIANDCHIFCEIRRNGQWHMVDVGGGVGNLNVQKPEGYVEERESAFGFFKRLMQKNLISIASPRNAQNLHMQNRSEVPVNIKVTPATEGVNVSGAPKTLSQQKIDALPKSILQHANSAELAAYGLGLLQHYTHKGVPTFYVNSYADLQSTENTLLRDFIKNNAATHKQNVIIVNWNNFTHEQIVQANTMLDRNPHINGVKFSKNTHLIGLQDANAPEAYKDSDFYSRFEVLTIADPKIARYSLPNEPLDPKDANRIAAKEDSIIIDFFEADYWQDYLFGKVGINENGAYFQESEFLKKLTDNPSAIKRIILKNPPWDNDSFKVFWSKALIEGKFVYQNQTYAINPALKIQFTNHYDWGLSNSYINWVSEHNDSDNSYTLNNMTIEQFFKQFYFADGKLKEAPGIIEAAANRKPAILELQLSHNITKGKWAELLQECARHKVQLRIIPCPNLDLPLGFIAPTNEFGTREVPTQAIRCFISDNPKQTAKSIARENTVHAKIAETLDVTEEEPEYLKANIEYTVYDNHYTYKVINSDIIARLEQGENIVLYGDLSKDFSESFASMLTGSNPYLIINGERKTFKGKLFVVTNETDAEWFAFSAHKNVKSGNAIPNPVLFRDRTLSFTATEDQNAHRTSLLEDVLKLQPMVYISGPTGVGKSTFIYDHLRSSNRIVFDSLNSIEEWAKAKGDAEAYVLFIDEANMTSSDFTIFRSMFDEHPPKILLNGKILTLTEKHKVVLAGNPLSYQGERRMPKLLKQHPEIEITFSPQTKKFISDNVLNDPTLDQHLKELLLDMYHWTLTLDSKNVLITPRDLKMVVQLVNSGYNQNYAIATIFLHALKANKHADFFENYHETLGAKNYTEIINAQLEDKDVTIAADEYILTHSRLPALLRINAMLDVRESALDTKVAPAISGLIIEGEPGVGKSELLEVALKSKGYVKADPTDLSLSSVEAGSKTYVVLPAGMHSEQKSQLLQAAYFKDLVVIYDEINAASTSMEDLLNPMLSHEFRGEKGAHSGFLLLSTQNPISFKGRKAISKALANRMLHFVLPQYTPNEMKSVLIQKYAKDLTVEQINKAVDDHLNNAKKFFGVATDSTFRDLERKVNQMATTKNRLH